MQKIAIIDYGMGNLLSVKKKLDQLNVDAIITSDKETILSADKIILPGVGHFGKAMENLKKLGLIDTLNEAVLVQKKPILGICLGMQLMAKYSEETKENREQRIESRETRTESREPNEQGLGWIDAEVVKFQFEDTLRFKVPHTGWNQIEISKESKLMDGIENGSEFYFVHSFFMSAQNEGDVLTNTEYGKTFVSSISKGNMYGVQFHPEKSHDVGLQLLRNFITL